MRNRRGEQIETYHLVWPVCSALPGTSCIDHAAKVARAPLFDPKLVSAAPQGRRPRNSIEPHGGPWSVPDADQEPASSPEGTWCRLACSPEIHEGSTPSALLSAATAVSGAGLAFAGAATAPQTSGSACA